MKTGGKPRRGITLIEALVAATIFLAVLGVAVMSFEYGVRGCLQAGSRADLQTQAARALGALQNDLRRSSDDSVAVQIRPGALRRDGVCFAGRSDWSGAPGTYNVTTGSATYDRFIHYYATTETAGRLVRSVLKGPDPPAVGAPILATYSLALYGNDNPSLNLDQGGWSVLSEQVREFAVAQIDARRVQIRLLLTGQAGPGPTGGAKRGEQSYEMVLEVYPVNTAGGGL